MTLFLRMGRVVVECDEPGCLAREYMWIDANTGAIEMPAEPRDNIAAKLPWWVDMDCHLCPEHAELGRHADGSPKSSIAYRATVGVHLEAQSADSPLAGAEGREGKTR